MSGVRKPRRGDELDVAVTGLDDKGGAFGRAEWEGAAYRVRMRGAVPGARVRAEVLKRRGERIEARVGEVLEESAAAVAPRCAHAGSCGGCSFQGLDYAAQLSELGALLERQLAPLTEAAGGALPIEPVLPCADPWGYRNKMDFTFSNRRWIEEHEPAGAPDGFALGLHVTGRHDKVLDVARCEIQFEEANAILASVRELVQSAGLPPWDLRAHTGLVRHVVLRKAVATGEILLDLVTAEDAPELVEPLAAALVARHPELTTVVQNVNTRAATIAVGERERVLHGPGVIRERLGGLEFEVSANSFFQTNTAQAEELLAVVREEAALAGNELLFDLYCGAGVFALALAGDAREVVGFELAPSAVEDARRNAGRNGVSNAVFIDGDIATTLAEHGGPSPDVCVVDPPRAGMHPRVIAALRRAAPARIVLVSCNPKAAARDLAPFVADGYRVTRVCPLDLFPHTPHVECVFTLVRGATADGLCPRCEHVRTVATERSTFYLCERSRADQGFARYPPQPVLSCPGFEQ